MLDEALVHRLCLTPAERESSPASSMKRSSAVPTRGSAPLSLGSSFWRTCSSSASCHPTPSWSACDVDADIVDNAIRKGGDPSSASQTQKGLAIRPPSSCCLRHSRRDRSSRSCARS